MAIVFYLSLLFYLVVYATTKYAIIPHGVSMTCHQRYFMISVNQHLVGKNISFEAVDGNGSYSITEEYANKCGYSLRTIHFKNRVQLRASYFSCHTDEVDKMYTFSFNLVAHDKEDKVTHALNRTCAPSLPWSLREVTCEVNYMEVSVRSEIACPTATRRNDWDNLKLAHGNSSADWQVTFQNGGEQFPPTSINEALGEGYVFDLTSDRLVFRTPYGQPHSFTSVIDGVPVEVVHATLFSRQSWLVLLVDLVAACSVYKATFEDEGYMSWETPDVMYPGLHTTHLSFGLDGNLMQPAVAKTKGYVIEKYNNTVEIGIPYDAAGSDRKSVVSGGLYESYSYDFYMEQLSVDEDGIETRLRTHRTMRTPLLMRTLLDENRTVLQEKHFTIYLGDIPQDVELISLTLNEQIFQVPFTNISAFSLVKVVHPNDTHGYSLKVPFYNSPVIQQFSTDNIEFKLYINYTLMVTPENNPFQHKAFFMATIPDLDPPQFDASCSESLISFKLAHKPSNSKWEFTVGSDPLTPELASSHGFAMSNNSQALQFDVPLLSDGYDNKNFSLQGFEGTFEIYVRDRETSQIQSSTVKSCPFLIDELLVCSTDMKMVALVNLTLAVVSGEVPANMTLRDRKCGPRQSDDTKALFTFPMNGCGSTVKLGKGTVTYENEVLYSEKFVSEDADRVFLQCTYPVMSLHRLFSVKGFESDTPGVGRIIHTSESAAGLPSTKAPVSQPQPHPRPHSSSRYIKFSEFKTQQLKLGGLGGVRALRNKKRLT
ncbi:unnamed protein product [Knipowitschia caucasica]|uniref:ZP domain-containing protein n=1 Tax=Knipowitschia caucasica TaxID=637954 RepID=A0AAV2KLZ5_KNICA